MTLVLPGLDALRQLAAEASGESARALGKLVGAEPTLDTVEALAAPDADALAALFGRAGADLVAVAMELAGVLGGKLVLVAAAADAERVAGKLAPAAAAGSLDTVGESALVEAANIAGSAFVSALARRLHRRLLHSVPRLTRGRARACVDELVGTPAGPALAAHYRAGASSGMLVFLPDPARAAALLALMEGR